MARTSDLFQTGGNGSYIETIGSPNGYDILINGSNHYINFGSVVGSAGYGFRDNAGTMQVKDSGGSWVSFSSLGAVTSVSNSDGTLTISPTTGAVVASLGLAKPANGGFGISMLRTNVATTGTINNQALTTGWLNFTGSGAVTLTGLDSTGVVDGTEAIITNSTTATVSLSNENASSLAANRFSTSITQVLQARGSLRLRYNGTTSRWTLAVPSIPTYTAPLSINSSNAVSMTAAASGVKGYVSTNSQDFSGEKQFLDGVRTSIITDSGGNKSIYPTTRILYASDGNTTSAEYSYGFKGYDGAGNIRLDTSDQTLSDSSSLDSIRWSVRELINSSSVTVFDWELGTFWGAYSMPTSDGTAGDVITTDGAGTATWQPAGSGSQTPWAQDIAASGYSLTGLGPNGGTYALEVSSGNSYFSGALSVSTGGTSAAFGASGVAAYISGGSEYVYLGYGGYSVDATGPLRVANGSYHGSFGNGQGGYASDGTNNVYLANGYSIQATGLAYFSVPNYWSFFGNSSAVEANDNASNQVKLADGTYAINATGNNQFLAPFGYNWSVTMGNVGNGAISATGDFGSVIPAGYFVSNSTNVTLADGTYAINATGQSYFADGTSSVSLNDGSAAGYFTDSNSNIAELANYSYGISATRGSGIGLAAGYFDSSSGNTVALSSATYAINVTAGDSYFAGKSIHNNVVRLKGYTVATLPATPTQGDTAFVTDALLPSFLVTVVGGGAVVAPVFYDGTNWVAH